MRRRKTQITTENQPEFPSLVSFESWLKHFADSVEMDGALNAIYYFISYKARAYKI